MTRRAAGSKAGKTRRRNTKSRQTRHLGSASTLQKQLRARKHELAESRKQLAEALEEQAATANVLKVISRSAFDLQSVFDMLVETSTRLCQASASVIWRPQEDGLYHLTASYGVLPKFKRKLQGLSLKQDGRSVVGRCLQKGQTVYVPDLMADPHYAGRSVEDFGGYRGLLCVPLMREGAAIGVLMVGHIAACKFSDKQIALVTTFADQAVIAIENTRLFEAEQRRGTELTEALEQQTATSEVLQVISSSPSELEPVFETILENAVRICEAKFGTLYLYEEGGLRSGAGHDVPRAFAEARSRGPFTPPPPDTALGGAVTTKQTVQVADLAATQSYADRNPVVVAGVEVGGARTVFSVPMLKDNDLIGVISIYRKEVRPFSDKQIALVENFAKQAVIAIENARLLNELHQRTDDLTESLEQQTATSEVLGVISSSPGDLTLVFDAMLANAVRVCGSTFGALHMHEGEMFRTVAVQGAPPAYVEARMRDGPFRPGTGTGLARAAATKQFVHIEDIRLGDAFQAGDSRLRQAAIEGGVRTLLAVPMLKDDNLIGVIAIYRSEVRPFTDKQIELVKNFAAQAVIAIENTRLLNELRESLERQTATTDVLQVISSSPGELEPVFKSVLANATKLCEAAYGALWIRDGNRLRHAGFHGVLPEAFRELWYAGSVIPADADVPVARSVRARKPVAVEDLKEDNGYQKGEPLAVGAVDLAGIRTLIAVPMLKENDYVGVIAIYRREVKPFSDKQIAVLANFAAQAVIAIENARLLNELRESLEQQTATSDVLKVIASSTSELQKVFSTMLANAARLCEASYGMLWLREGEAFRTAALHGELPQAYIDQWRSGTLFRPKPAVVLARLTESGQRVKWRTCEPMSPI